MNGRVIGLCGPIGSGKSSFATVAQSLGWEVVDVDKLAHALYAPGTELSQQIFAAFGDAVRTPENAVDRKALGGIVFADAVRLRQLESLVHPLIHQEMDALVARARFAGSRLVMEAAILPRRLEFCKTLDAVVAVMAPEPVRLLRVMARDGLSQEHAMARLAKAVPPETIATCATHEVLNDTSFEVFRKRCEEVLVKLCE